MAKRIEFLSREAIDALRADHERLRVEVAQLRVMLRALMNGDDHAPVEYGKTDGSGIAAMNASGTPGSGTVTIYRWPGGAASLVSTGKEETCYSTAGSVAANTFVTMERDKFGRLIAIVEKC